MNRRDIIKKLTGGAVFGAVAGKVALSGPLVTGDAFERNLIAEEEAVYRELQEKQIIQIPSRRSNLSTPELREKLRVLKRLVHKNRVCIDFFVAIPNDETCATCLVFYLPGEGRTPLDNYR